MVLLRSGQGGIVEDSQDGAIRKRAQRPLPVIIIVVGSGAEGTELHGSQERVQRDVYIDTGARAEADLLPQCGKKRGRDNFYSVQAGEKTSGGVESCAVGEDGHTASRGA